MCWAAADSNGLSIRTHYGLSKRARSQVSATADLPGEHASMHATRHAEYARLREIVGGTLLLSWTRLPRRSPGGTGDRSHSRIFLKDEFLKPERESLRPHML